MKSETVFSPFAPAPIGPYSQARKVHGFVFTAGQIALDVEGTLVGDDAAAQTRQVIANLQAVLAAAGASFADVVKTTIFLKDMNDFAEVNNVYGKFFGDSAPARSTVQVSRLPKDALVEIEAVAFIG